MNVKILQAPSELPTDPMNSGMLPRELPMHLKLYEFSHAPAGALNDSFELSHVFTGTPAGSYKFREASRHLHDNFRADPITMPSNMILVKEQ